MKVVWPRWHSIRDLLRDGRHEGLIPKDAYLSVMTALFSGAAIGWHVCGFNEDRGGFAKNVMNALWSGIGASELRGKRNYRE